MSNICSDPSSSKCSNTLSIFICIHLFHCSNFFRQLLNGFLVHTHDGHIMKLHSESSMSEGLFLDIPHPMGFDKIINALSKCQDPPVSTIFLSSSVSNLNKNTLLPMLLTFTFLMDLHTYLMAYLRPSNLTPLVSSIFSTRQFVVIFIPFAFILPNNATVFYSSSFSVIAWHLRIISSVFMILNVATPKQ